jgi:hypothetical protein
MKKSNNFAFTFGSICLASALFLQTSIAVAGSDNTSKVVNSVSHAQVAHSLAASAHYSNTSPAYKWGQKESRASQPANNPWSEKRASNSGYKWVTSASSQTGNQVGEIASNSSYTLETMGADTLQASYPWGVRSFADQAGYRWKIRSHAEQAGYRWKIRGYADQAGYRWKIRSYADQASY